MQQSELWDALELTTLCQQQFTPWTPTARPQVPRPTVGDTVVVSTGPELQAALNDTTRTPGAPRTILLKGGTYYMNDTITLGPQHSNTHITVQSTGDDAVLSGARRFESLTWTKDSSRYFPSLTLHV